MNDDNDEILVAFGTFDVLLRGCTVESMWWAYRGPFYNDCWCALRFVLAGGNARTFCYAPPYDFPKPSAIEGGPWPGTIREIRLGRSAPPGRDVVSICSYRGRGSRHG